MRTTFLLALALTGMAQAQQVVAPTPAQVGSARGDNAGNYNVTQSFELGYRWSLVGGNYGMYRSVENFGNGVRLLGSNLTVNSRDGHGGLFDEILLNTVGLGNDPYEAAMLRIQKNSLYRYDMSWRLNSYYNPGLTVAGSNGLDGTPAIGISSNLGLASTGSLHIRDTQRRLQDHDLTLLPQSRFRFRVGYSRNMEDGPALSTAQEFDTRGPGLPIFADLKRSWNEYRVGADVDFSGFRFSVTRRWDFFKEDTPYGSLGTAASLLATDQSSLTQFRRAEPIHGSNPGWLGNLTGRKKMWGVNARLTYVAGSRNFIEDEVAFGTSQFGGAGSRQILVTGNASRPNLAGDFSISLYPKDTITVVNNTSISSNRIDGPSSYSEVQNGFDLGQTVNFRYLGIRTVTNTTDLNARLTRVVGVYAEYGYSDRLVRTIEAFSIPGLANASDTALYEVSNHLNTGRLGVRIRPIKPFTINVDGEIGRANNPLTPISGRNYHSVNGRAEYRTRRTQLSTSYRQLYNLGAPFALGAYSSHNRQYSANASWSPRDAISFDASYSKLHLDTQSGLQFFAATGLRPTLQTGYTSFYRSNVHAANLGVRLVLLRRADLYTGYSITKDTGDGRLAPGNSGPIGTLLSSVQSFPLTYQSPLLRLSVRITPKLRWNAGYQFYNYAEDIHLFGYVQNFRANTGFTSVLWSF